MIRAHQPGAYRHPGSDSESCCSAKQETRSQRTRSQKARQRSGEGGQDCVIAAFCNEVVTAEGTAGHVHKPLGHGSALPFEELLIPRDFTLVGAPQLQPGRDHPMSSLPRRGNRARGRPRTEAVSSKDLQQQPLMTPFAHWPVAP
jgi:hypothetical protein